MKKERMHVHAAAGTPIRTSWQGRLKAWGHLVLDLFLFLCLFLLLLMLFSGVVGFLPVGGGARDSVSFQVGMLLTEAGTLAAALLAAWVVLLVRRVPFARLGLSLAGRGRDFAWGVGLIVVLYAVGFGLSCFVGGVRVVGVSFVPGDLLFTWVFFLLVSLFEEVMMRGFVLGRMLDWGVSKGWALLWSSVLFSLAHFFNPNFSLVAFVNIVLAGVFLGVSYVYTRNLCLPVILHWLWNWVQGPVLGYQVSGNSLGESWLHLDVQGNAWLTGGDFGFEGSLIASVVLLAGTWLTLRLYKE